MGGREVGRMIITHNSRGVNKVKNGLGDAGEFGVGEGSYGLARICLQ